jgi:hypothetical protein
VVYAVTQGDKYDLGSTAEFDDHEKAVRCAKAMESEGYHWAGVLDVSWMQRIQTALQRTVRWLEQHG